MERKLITELKNGDKASICGWVDSMRDHGKVLFIDVRDRSGILQCVVKQESPQIEEIKALTPESVVCVKGEIKERTTKDGANALECVVEDITVLVKAEILPFEKDADVSIEVLLDNRPLTLRNKKQKEVFLVQASIVEGFRNYLSNNGFTEFMSPKLVGGDAEGGAEVFKLDYFGQSASLATSPQLYKQIMVGVYERVFTIGNVFRAEKHSTSRHLNEYTSLDFEMGFIDSEEDVMKVIEGVLSEMKKSVMKLDFVSKESLPTIPESIPRITLKEAKKKINAEDTPDLTPEEERDICEYAKNELGSDAVFITEYPMSKRPMYTMPKEDDPLLSKSFDLLLRGREAVTGSQRIHKYEDLKKSIENKGLDAKKFEFYLQAFKYGMPPHGGCGMGLERLTAAFLNIKNVKEASLFPRDMTRIDTPISE